MADLIIILGKVSNSKQERRRVLFFKVELRLAWMPSRSAAWYPLGASCLSFRSVKSIGLRSCRIPRGEIKSDPNPDPRGLVRSAILTCKFQRFGFKIRVSYLKKYAVVRH